MPPSDLRIHEDPAPPKFGTRLFWIDSPFQRGRNAVEVLVPDAPRPGERFRVLYTLPVNTGTSGTWGCALEELRRHDVHTRHRVMIVAPAYDVEPWIGDLPAPPADGSPWIRQRRYLTEVVVPLVDRVFPTLPGPEGRMLLGFSKSAPPALAIFLRHPDLFGRVGLYDNAEPDLVDERFDAWQLAASYGSREHYLATGPLALLQNVTPQLRTGPSRIVLMAGSARYEGVNKLRNALRTAGLPFDNSILEGCGHSWRDDWLPRMADALLG